MGAALGDGGRRASIARTGRERSRLANGATWPRPGPLAASGPITPEYPGQIRRCQWGADDLILIRRGFGMASFSAAFAAAFGRSIARPRRRTRQGSDVRAADGPGLERHELPGGGPRPGRDGVKSDRYLPSVRRHRPEFHSARTRGARVDRPRPYVSHHGHSAGFLGGLGPFGADYENGRFRSHPSLKPNPVKQAS
jgi:hypothetical protein